MKKVRAKFECINIEDQPDYQQKVVEFVPVLDGSDENKSFAKYTPAGSITLTISDETEASTAFEKGKEYFVDFSEA
nr:hypothetical protein [uncultured Carboxylicivirga sp.]